MLTQVQSLCAVCGTPHYKLLLQ